MHLFYDADAIIGHCKHHIVGPIGQETHSPALAGIFECIRYQIGQYRLQFVQVEIQLDVTTATGELNLMSF